MIPQTTHTFCAEAFDPFGDSLRRDVELTRGSGMAQPFFNNTAHHSLSTFGRQRRILVSVHSVPRESLTFGDISLHGQGRVDNLLKVHS